MSDKSLYKKYGSTTPDFDALVSGQKAVGASLKEALAGVGDLMDIQEKKYTEENTLNMQEYLKSNIKNAGLGAIENPTDKEAIKRQFGSRINMEQLDATINETTTKMKNEAVDAASGFAGKTFAQTEDLASAAGAFRQSILDAGGNETLANKLTKEWQTDNQYLADNIEAANTKMINDSTSALYGALASGEIDENTALQNTLAGLPEKLRPKATALLKQNIEDWSKLSTEDQAELATASARLDNYVAGREQELQFQVQQHKQTYDAVADKGVPDVTYNLVDELSKNLGGPLEAMSKEAQNGWFVGTIRTLAGGWNPNELTGYDVGEYIGEEVQKMISDGVAPKDAMAIGVKAFQDVKAADSEGSIGTRLTKTSLKDSMENYRQQQATKLQAQTNYFKAQQAAAQQINALNDKAITTKADWTKRERVAARTGKAVETSFSDKIFGGEQPAVDASTQEKPDDTVSENTNDPNKNPFPAILERADKMNQETNPENFKQNILKSGETPQPVDESGRTPMTKMIGGKQVSEEEYYAATDEVGKALFSAPAGAVKWAWDNAPIRLAGKGAEKAWGSFQKWAKAGGFNAKDITPEVFNKFAEESPEKAAPLLQAAAVDIAINEAVAETGVSKEFLETLAQIESAGDPNAKNKSGAKGLYQFMPRTAKEFNIAGNEFDAKASALAAAQLAKRNGQQLKKAGFQPSEENLYLAHQQGATGIISILKAAETGDPISAGILKNMMNNLPKSLRGKTPTPQEFVDAWHKEYLDKKEKLGAS